MNETLAALDFAPRCEADRTHAAELYLRCRDCKDTHLLCSESLAKARYVSRHAARLQTRCCLKVYSPSELEEQFEIGALA